jgi:hypothetical protein
LHPDARARAPLVLIAIAAVSLASCHGLTRMPAPHHEADPQPHHDAIRCPPPSQGAAAGYSLPCARVPDRLIPRGAEGTAMGLGATQIVVRWTGTTSSGFAIWRRTAHGFAREYVQESDESDGYQFLQDDVTQDGLADLLVSEGIGSGDCGPRLVLGVQRTRVVPLFRHDACELQSSMQDGLLTFREPVGHCRSSGAHCYSGIRLTIRGWNGSRIDLNHTIVRCFLPSRPGSRGCRTVANRLAMGLH